MKQIGKYGSSVRCSAVRSDRKSRLAGTVCGGRLNVGKSAE